MWAETSVWGNWSGLEPELEPATPWHREASRWILLSVAHSAKTGLDRTWCYYGTSQACQPHVNPPNLGSQALL